MTAADLLSPRKPLQPRLARTLTVASFLLPLLVWAIFSYVPFVWHPEVLISEPGGVSYFKEGMRIDSERFAEEAAKAEAAGLALPEGKPSNPIYLPAPHEVATAFYTAFSEEPQMRSQQWLHESLWHSIQIIVMGFVLSSIVGVPLGILCGTYSAVSKTAEPFVEFFRYLPAPAFGALAVAILGIYDGPKIAIIFIGTFFQQVLVIANTTRRLDISLLEAARTLGAKRLRLLFKVVVPGILPELYRDQRILLGWAWTYLIVAELIGTSSGITWFITQQARYKNFDNVYAAIIMIGVIGLATDLILAKVGRRLFPWEQNKTKA